MFHLPKRSALLFILLLAISLFAATEQGTWPWIAGDELMIINKMVIRTGANYNHPANIEEHPNGDLMIITVAGSNEGENTMIAVIRSTDGGTSWEDPVNITPSGRMFDPTLAIEDNGDIYAFYYHSDATGCCNNHKFRVSTDNGETWGEEHDVSSDPLARQAGEQSNCLRHPNGDYLCGWSRTCGYGGNPVHDSAFTSHIPSGELGNPGAWTVHYSMSHLWSPDFGVIDPDNVVDGHFQEIFAFMRNQFCNNKGWKWGFSTDGGVTWTHANWVDPTNGVGCPEKEGVEFGAAGTAVSLDMGVAGSPSGPLKGWNVIGHCTDIRWCHDFPGCDFQHCRRYAFRIWTSNNPVDPGSWEENLEIRETSGGSENADCSIIQSQDRYLHAIWTGRGSRVIRYLKLDTDRLITGSSTRAGGIAPVYSKSGRAAAPGVMVHTAGKLHARDRCYTIRGQFISAPKFNVHKGVYFAGFNAGTGENAIRFK
ncbi:MAG: hypothetical protein GF350_02310 [Chitinivibrionales bacterium]|nr:hypothetical protein [Chitinivibrionales bacterium]